MKITIGVVDDKNGQATVIASDGLDALEGFDDVFDIGDINKFNNHFIECNT